MQLKLKLSSICINKYDTIRCDKKRLTWNVKAELIYTWKGDGLKKVRRREC